MDIHEILNVKAENEERAREAMERKSKAAQGGVR
jgi:hypothetical protein